MIQLKGIPLKSLILNGNNRGSQTKSNPSWGLALLQKVIGKKAVTNLTLSQVLSAL